MHVWILWPDKPPHPTPPPPLVPPPLAAAIPRAPGPMPANYVPVAQRPLPPLALPPPRQSTSAMARQEAREEAVQSMQKIGKFVRRHPVKASAGTVATVAAIAGLTMGGPSRPVIWVPDPTYSTSVTANDTKSNTPSIPVNKTAQERWDRLPDWYTQAGIEDPPS